MINATDGRGRNIQIILAVIAMASAVVGCAPSSEVDTDFAGDLSEFESSVLSDGTVTRMELEESRSLTVNCLTEEGFTASFVPVDDRISVLDIDSGVARPSESPTEFEARFDLTIEVCKGRYNDDVEVAWLRQTAPSDEEMRAALVDLQSCVAPYEVVVGSNDAEGLAALFQRIDQAKLDDSATMEALVGCLQEYSLRTPVPSE